MLSRLAELGIRRPRAVAVLAAVAFLVVGALGGPAAGIRDRDRAFDDPGASSTDARLALERATGQAAEPGVLVLVDGAPGSAAVASAVRTLDADRAVARVTAPPSATGGSPLVSRDGTRTVVAATLRAHVDREAAVERLEDAFADRRDARLGGPDVAFVQVGQQASEDLAGSELLALPVLALLTFLFFRGIAAALPLAIGGLTVLATFALLRLANLAVDLSPFALNLVIAAGLGLAIDYSLFLVSRFREELGDDRPIPDAVRRTMATAGRTVVFSSVTVAAALACLCVFPLPFLQSMGIGGALVSLVAAASSLAVLPALFVLLGRRLGKVRPLPEGQGRWHRLASAVMRRPGRFAIVAAVVMLVLAAPALRTAWTGVDASILPESKSARVVADAMAREFPAVTTNPITVAVTAPSQEPDGVQAYASALARIPGVERVAPPRPVGPALWQVDVTARGSAISDEAMRTVQRIRDAAGDQRVLVGGASAAQLDQRDAISRMLPLAAGLLLAATLSILWLMTGSVLLPIKALLMNVLTTAAATGILVWVFQDGRLEALLGYRSQGGIEQTDFLVMVAIAFGLSTDYGVFLLTRIKEARDARIARGAGPELEREAVAVGIQRTGAIVSAAAILLAVALGAFLTSDVVFLQQLGLGAAAAVLLDAFIVRTLLVPSLMALLGRWNWWSPRPLQRLHARIGISEGPPPEPAQAAAGARPGTPADVPR
jgi:RND superfamily putative drug exporter